MNRSFILTGLLTTVINLLFHALAAAFILNDVYRTYPVISPEFQAQLAKPMDQLIIWAMAVTSLAMGFLITTVMKWSGARTFSAGLKHGAILGALYWGAVNFGLYAASNFFSTVAVFVDFLSSATIMTIASAFAAWLLGKMNA